MIKLSANDIIGKGRERIVYLHPQEERYCIKTARRNHSRNKRAMLREIKYLKRHQDYLDNLSNYQHKISTNVGVGYVFDLVRDYNGPVSKTLSFYIETSRLPLLVGLKVKINNMFNDLLTRNAVVHDLKPRNILIQWHSKSTYSLILVDGFGNSDFIKICDYSSKFAFAKLNRKFKILNTIIENHGKSQNT